MSAVRELLKRNRLAVGAYMFLKGRMLGRAFRREFDAFRDMSVGRRTDMPVDWTDRYPCLFDRTATTGFDTHYVFHTAWAARVLAANRPSRHVDISSSLYFVSLVSAFLDVDFYDYRPAELGLSGLKAGRADLTALPFADGSVSSLSCMHVVEHIGLGRYGDPLDPLGDLTAMRELARVLAPGGDLLFVVPVGRARVCFNAHRVYAPEMIVREFAGLELREFALIPDDADRTGLLRDADLTLGARQEYGCGCFHFRKSGANRQG